MKSGVVRWAAERGRRGQTVAYSSLLYHECHNLHPAHRPTLPTSPPAQLPLLPLSCPHHRRTCPGCQSRTITITTFNSSNIISSCGILTPALKTAVTDCVAFCAPFPARSLAADVDIYSAFTLNTKNTLPAGLDLCLVLQKAPP